MEQEDVEAQPFVDALKAEDAVEKNGLTCIPRDLVWMAMRSGFSLFEEISKFLFPGVGKKLPDSLASKVCFLNLQETTMLGLEFWHNMLLEGYLLNGVTLKNLKEQQ